MATFPRMALLAIGLAACAGHHAAPDDDSALAEDGSDTSAVEDDTETMTTSLIAPGGATLGLASTGDLGSGTMQLDDIGDAVKANYLPAGCATVTNDAANHIATYAFTGCTGPHGLRALSGTIKVTYGNTEPPLTLDFVATSLQVNRTTVNWTAHAAITAGDLGRRDMDWSATLTGTTAHMKAISRTNHKQISWSVGGECVTMSGSSDGQVGSRGLHTDIINYVRCKGECPAAGSEVRITNTDNGRSIDITYRGGGTATYTGSNGAQSTVNLTCGP